MQTLPLLDEHATVVPAPRDAVWDAVQRYGAGLAGAGLGPFGRLLGAEPRSGFAVEPRLEDGEVVLAGRHRFARYRLVFAVADGPGPATMLSARSYAVFPGRRGAAYRACVVGSRGHVLAVRRMLRAIRAAALTGTPDSTDQNPRLD